MSICACWRKVYIFIHLFFFSRTGLLYCGAENDVRPVINSLTVHGVKHEVLRGAEVNVKYNEQLNVPDDDVCVLEDDGGILMASKAISTFQVPAYEINKMCETVSHFSCI